MRRELKWKLNTTFAFFIMLICSCKNIKIQRTLLIYRNRVYKVCFSFISLTVRRPDSGLDHSRLWRARTARTWLKNALKNLIKDPSTYFKEKTEGSSSYSSSSSSSDSSVLFFSRRTSSARRKKWRRDRNSQLDTKWTVQSNKSGFHETGSENRKWIGSGPENRKLTSSWSILRKPLIKQK